MQALSYRSILMLLQGTEGYKPGWFRQHLTGDTHGIKALKQFCHARQVELDTPLNQTARDELLEIICNRALRFRHFPTNLDITRSPKGETSRIFTHLIIRILETDKKLLALFTEHDALTEDDALNEEFLMPFHNVF